MKKLFYTALIIATVVSCKNEPLEDSKKYEPSVLQESHVITYDGQNDNTSVESMIKTGSSENYSTGELNGGKYVMLTEPASLEVNAEPMKLDSERFVGSAYTWEKTGFVKNVVITYTNQKSEKFTYNANVNPISMKDDYFEVYRDGSSYFLKWIGEPIGENEEVSLYLEYKEKDQKGKSKTKNMRIDNDRAGEAQFNISKIDLDKLRDNDRIEVYTERKKSIKSSSSSNPCMVIYKYRSSRLFLKTKPNLFDLLLSN